MLAAPTLAGWGGDPLKTLLNALGSQRDVCVSMVQVRSEGEQTITVSVQIVPNRGIRATIMQPLVYSGMVSLDDGEVWKNYDPHEDMVRIEKSPAKFKLEMSFRKRLIEKNFTVSQDGTAIVAGRSTDVIVLKARKPDMADRRLYIDRSTSLILRYVVIQPESSPLTTIDTKSVTVGPEVDMEKFVQIGSADAKVVKAWGPIDVPDTAAAARYAGFEPRIPPDLPAGLERQAIHVVGSSNRPFVGVRLTDGMAVVTVYLWQSKGGGDRAEAPFKDVADAVAPDGTRCKVVGDVSPRVREALATAFARLYPGPMLFGGTPNGTKDVLNRGYGAGRSAPPLVRMVIDE